MTYSSSHLISALVLGVAIGASGVWFSQPAPTTPPPQMDHSAMNHEMPAQADHDMSMDGMTQALLPLEGEAREKKFLELMIVHHQGAVEMAELVEEAPHAEVRKLSKDIISAQNTEIKQMQSWLQEWYPSQN